MLIYEMPDEWTSDFSSDELECQFEGYNAWIDRMEYENKLFDKVTAIGMEVLNNDR